MYFLWHPTMHRHTLDSKVVHYNCSGECATTNLRDSQLAVWHGANLWQLHCQFHAARNSCCVSLHLELVVWLLRLRKRGGDDLDKILLFVLRRLMDNLGCRVHVLFLRAQGGDLPYKGSRGLTGCKEEHYRLLGKVVEGERWYTCSSKRKYLWYKGLTAACQGIGLITLPVSVCLETFGHWRNPSRRCKSSGLLFGPELMRVYCWDNVNPNCCWAKLRAIIYTSALSSSLSCSTAGFKATSITV